MTNATTTREANAFSASIAHDWAKLPATECAALLSSFDSSDYTSRCDASAYSMEHTTRRVLASPPLADLLAECDESTVDARTDVDALLSSFSM